MFCSGPCPGSEAGLDTKVEIILAAAILSLIVLLFTWSVQWLQYSSCTVGRCLITLTSILFYVLETLCVCYNYKHKYDA